MDIVKLLTKVYYEMGDTYKHIISFYEKEQSQELNMEKFIKVCEKHQIIIQPNILFNFLDFMNVKLAIFPMFDSEFWSYRIYCGKKINICNNFTSREEATLLGLESAFNTYNENNKQDEKQTSKLS